MSVDRPDAAPLDAALPAWPRPDGLRPDAAPPNADRTILLARHGEATWTGRRYAGTTDIPLTDAGRAGAAELANAIAASGILRDPGAVVVASPLARALDTARAIAKAVDRPLRVDPRWREVSFGELEGLTFEEVAVRWPDLVRRLFSADLAIDWPGGEPWSDLRARAAAAWSDVVALGVPVVVVGHGIVIRAALEVVRPASMGQLAVMPPMRPASAIALRRCPPGWEIDADWAAAVGTGDRASDAEPAPAAPTAAAAHAGEDA